MSLPLLSKDEQAVLVGKRGWSPREVIGKLNYASGIDDLDAERKPGPWQDVPVLMNIGRRELGLALDTMIGFKRYFTGIPYEWLSSVAVEPAARVIEQKERSVVGRALVGGLLLGPVGAVVGGMTGLKDERVNKTPDAFVTVTLKGPHEGVVVLTCEDRHVAEVQRFLAGLV